MERNLKALAKLVALIAILGTMLWFAEKAPPIETTPGIDPVPQGMY